MLVVTYVVKLKHDDVRFPAIYARVCPQVCIYVCTNTVPGYLTVLLCAGNNSLTMLRETLREAARAISDA